MNHTLQAWQFCAYKSYIEHSVNSLHILLTEVVIRVRNSLALAEQGRGVAIVRYGGTRSVKWFREYRAKRFKFVGSKRNKAGEDTHSHTCLSGQLGQWRC